MAQKNLDGTDSTGLILAHLGGGSKTTISSQSKLVSDTPPEDIPKATPDMAHVITNCLNATAKKEQTNGK